MKRNQHLFTLLVLGSAVALAQEKAPTPVAEFGMNYSLFNSHPGTGAPSFNASGGSGTFAYNFNSMFSAVADLGGYHNTVSVNYDPTTFTYLFGPRVSLRRSRITPYAQALFGGARQWTSFVNPTTLAYNPPGNGFAAAFGGGMDIRVRDHILVKPFQMEYLMTQVSNPWSTAGTQNGLRYSAGVVFTLGSK
ncbi:MAG: hypothetical protein ABI693_06925 [Bryobacteraceae bacterium]